MRQVILRVDPEDGGWVAEVPSLPGCASQGDTKEEAVANVQDAIAGWISAAQNLNREVPEDRLEAEILQVAEKF